MDGGKSRIEMILQIDFPFAGVLYVLPAGLPFCVGYRSIGNSLNAQIYIFIYFFNSFLEIRMDQDKILATRP